MKKYKVEITQVNEYEIEIDETIYNEKWREDWAKVFFEFENTEDLVEHLALMQARGEDSFIEGFGHVKRDNRLITCEKGAKAVPGLNIIIKSEDEFETSIIKEIPNENKE